MVATALALTIAADVYLYVRERAADHYAQQASFEAMYRYPDKPASIGPPVGFTVHGEKINSTSNVRSGWVVRYADWRCIHCDNDLQWDLLAQELNRLGYLEFALLPSIKGHFPLASSDVAQRPPEEAYVSMRWMEQFRLTFTPTVLIFNSKGILIWHREGTLSNADRKSALRAVEPGKFVGE